ADTHPLLEATAPAAAPVNLHGALHGRPRIVAVAGARPLPNVPGHVVEPERAGRVLLPWTRRVILPARASIGRRVSPGVHAIVTAARGVLPLGFGREPAPSKLAIGGALRGVDAVDRLSRTVRRIDDVTGLRRRARSLRDASGIVGRAH